MVSQHRVKSTSLKTHNPSSKFLNSIPEFRRFYASPSSSSRPNFTKRKSEMPRISREAAEQIKKDKQLHETPKRLTGPHSGSVRSRKTEANYPRYPAAWAAELAEIEAESGPHLEAIKKHFSEDLGTSL